MAHDSVSKKVAIKVYVVLQRFVGCGGPTPDTKISSVWLTRKAADDAAQKTPRSWVERHLASK